MSPSDKKSAVAAAVILAVCGGGYLLMPKLMLALGDISPMAGTALALGFILLPFAILWLRARYQAKHRNDRP